MSLPMREREAVRKSLQDEYKQILDEEEVNLFTQYTKIDSILLHDYFGFTESELLQVIGCFRMLHRKFRNLKTAKEINEALDKEMERIFPSGFPQEYVENLQRENK